jgi:hypothetical protein
MKTPKRKAVVLAAFLVAICSINCVEEKEEQNRDSKCTYLILNITQVEHAPHDAEGLVNPKVRAKNFGY